MSTAELLTIEPMELKFSLEVGKQISCTLLASNRTENHVAFKVKTTNPKKYCVRPNSGVLLPQSTCDIMVTMQAQKELPADMNCKDKFLLQSVVASPGATHKDINSDMFNKDAGHVVEECKLKVIYLPPVRQPSLLAGGSKEETPTGASVSDSGHTNSSEVMRKYVDGNDQPSEELLRGDINRSRGGFSPSIVILIGLAGLVFAYYMKRT